MQFERDCPVYQFPSLEWLSLSPRDRLHSLIIPRTNVRPLQCDSSCATCSGPADDECLTCPANSYLEEGECIAVSDPDRRFAIFCTSLLACYSLIESIHAPS